MARNKYPEITEKRILDAALKLFQEKGYEQTTIQDIVDELGDLSKGAVYHHFKSKEDIVNAVSDRICLEANPLNDVRDMPELNGRQKIRQVLLLSLRSQTQRDVYNLFPSLLKNPKFLAQTVYDCMGLAKQMVSLVEEGNADGSLSVAYPKQAAETLMILSNIWISPAVFPVSREEFMQKIDFLGSMLEQIGLPVFDAEAHAAAQDFCNNLIPA